MPENVSFLLLFGALAAILLTLAWIAPHAAESWLRPLERQASSFARRKSVVVLALGAATVLLRVASLPLVPVPVPAMHDEFSYLLAADTFAHGRLTNPPHPMWVFFDTFHVLQEPTYASKYPPAPGAAMALGQILGHPWIGVLLSMAGMVMAITWMLQGWFPPGWAMLGGVLILLHLALFNTHWADSYLNMSVATIGAALVLGAYPRLFQSKGMLHSAAMGAGVVILAYSRPLEGLIFCVPVAIALLASFLGSRLEPHSRALDLKKFFPLCIVLAAGMVFLAYYNQRVTHNPLQLPYLLYHHRYFNDYPMFSWQEAPAALRYANPQFDAFFNTWNRKNYPLTEGEWPRRAVTALFVYWQVLPGFVLAPPFVLFPRILRDRRMRLPLLQLALCGAGLLSVVWFQARYAAPLAATFSVLLVQAMRHLRHSELFGRPVGLFLTRLTVLLAIIGVGLSANEALHSPPWARKRATIARQLEQTPGKHLVLVHYSPNHDVLAEWVYNRADIDGSKVVWAREIPGRDLGPLLKYFNGRHVWVLEADSNRPRLVEFSGLANGPGA